MIELELQLMYEDNEPFLTHEALDTINQDWDDYTHITSGLTLAHDLIEHIDGPETIGDYNLEIGAIAASWVTRGVHGQLRNIRKSTEIDLAENIADLICKAIEIPERYTAPVIKPIVIDDIHEPFVECLTDDMVIAVSDDYGSERCRDMQVVNQHIAEAQYIMRQSIQTMLATYGTSEQAYDVFMAVALAGDEILENAERMWGEELSITIYPLSNSPVKVSVPDNPTFQEYLNETIS